MVAFSVEWPSVVMSVETCMIGNTIVNSGLVPELQGAHVVE